jgi:hypothetical protein
MKNYFCKFDGSANDVNLNDHLSYSKNDIPKLTFFRITCFILFVSKWRLTMWTLRIIWWGFSNQGKTAFLLLPTMDGKPFWMIKTTSHNFLIVAIHFSSETDVNTYHLKCKTSLLRLHDTQPIFQCSSEFHFYNLQEMFAEQMFV